MTRFESPLHVVRRILVLAALSFLGAGLVRAQVVFSDDFESGTLEGWSFPSSQVASVTGVAAMGNRSLQNSWPAGAHYARIHRQIPSMSTVYLRVYWKASPGFTFNGSQECPTAVAQKKFLEINKGEYASRLGLFLQPANQCGHGGTSARMKWVATKTTGSDITVGSWNMFPDGTCTACPPGGNRNLSTNPEIRLTGGKWYCIEIGIQQAGAGQAAGSKVQVWVDDVLQIDVRDEQLGASSSWISLDGEHNGGVEQVQQEWFDNVAVSSQRIGCGITPPAGDAPPPSVTGLVRTDQR